MLKQYIGDRPLTAFALAAFSARLSRVAIAASVALVSGLSSVALAQERESSLPVVTPASRTPAIAPVETLGNPLVPAQDSSGLDSASENSILPAPVGDGVSEAPINAQRPELPFSDVSPDHWAYEALLYLSTGGRSPEIRP